MNGDVLDIAVLGKTFTLGSGCNNTQSNSAIVGLKHSKTSWAHLGARRVGIDRAGLLVTSTQCMHATRDHLFSATQKSMRYITQYVTCVGGTT